MGGSCKFLVDFRGLGLSPNDHYSVRFRNHPSLISCRLSGRTPPFEGENFGSSPDERTICTFLLIDKTLVMLYNGNIPNNKRRTTMRSRQGMNHKQLRKIIEADGWYLVRQTGDHQHFKHPFKRGLVTIPHNDISKNVELSALRQAGLR